MFTSRPVHVIDKVVYGHVRVEGSVKPLNVVQSAEVHKVLILQPRFTRSLADEAVAEVVDEIIAEYRRVAGDQAL